MRLYNAIMAVLPAMLVKNVTVNDLIFPWQNGLLMIAN